MSNTSTLHRSLKVKKSKLSNTAGECYAMGPKMIFWPPSARGDSFSFEKKNTSVGGKYKDKSIPNSMP